MEEEKKKNKQNINFNQLLLIIQTHTLQHANTRKHSVTSECILCFQSCALAICIVQQQQILDTGRQSLKSDRMLKFDKLEKKDLKTEGKKNNNKHRN